MDPRRGGKVADGQSMGIAVEVQVEREMGPLGRAAAVGVGREKMGSVRCWQVDLTSLTRFGPWNKEVVISSRRESGWGSSLEKNYHTSHCTEPISTCFVAL